MRNLETLKNESFWARIDQASRRFKKMPFNKVVDKPPEIEIDPTIVRFKLIEVD